MHADGDPASTVKSSVVEPAPPSDEYVLRKRPIWPIFAVLFAIIGGIGGVVYYVTTRPEPTRVLVAIDIDGQWWDGSRPAALLADEVAEGLTKIGFDPVKGGDPKVDKILSKAKSPEEAARKLGAAFVITGTLAPEVIDHPVEQGYVEVRTKAMLRVRYIGDPEGKVDEAEISSWAGAPTRDEAMKLLADHVADRVFDVAVPRITGHPVIAELLEGDLQTMVQLDEAKKYVKARDRALDRAKKAYEKADQDHAEGSKNPFPIRYHGTFAAQDALAGMADRGVLVHTADVTPFIVPSTLDMGWIYQLESLAWRDAEGKDQVMWSGYHLLGYPSAAPEGTPVVLVEDIFGWAKTITVVDGDGTSRRVRIDPKARFDSPKVAPGGGAAALYVRPCRRCASTFSVISLADGKTLYDRAASSGEEGEEGAEHYGGFAWVDKGKVAYFVRPTIQVDPEKFVMQELRSVDLSTGTPSDAVLAPLADGERCEWPSVARDGSTLVATCTTGEGWVLVFFDLRNGTRSGTAVRGSEPAFSPDAKKVTYNHGGGIALLDVASGDVTKLTDNSFTERYPSFSADGKHVYFESQQRDPNFDRRIVSVIASVAVP